MVCLNIDNIYNLTHCTIIYTSTYERNEWKNNKTYVPEESAIIKSINRSLQSNITHIENGSLNNLLILCIRFKSNRDTLHLWRYIQYNTCKSTSSKFSRFHFSKYKERI